MQLILALDKSSGVPLYRQMANAIRKSIQEGSLRPGQQMPSTRELAESMSVSKLTARRCYEQLSSQGYIKAYSRGKTFVTRDLPSTNVSPPAARAVTPVRLSSYGRRLIDDTETISEFNADLAFFVAANPNELPTARYHECLKEALRFKSSSLLKFERDSFGLFELREQLCSLLSRTRAINCSPEAVVVFPSTGGGLDLLCRLVLNEGDFVVTEEPCFEGIRENFRVNGARVVPVPLDEDGVNIEILKTLDQVPRLLYVTPSHQDTTGIPMTRLRRNKLLKWAESTGCIIVEDDFDSEFRFGEEPQPAMFSQGSSGTVVYKYNFWKSLYPLVRQSFLVIPDSLIPVFRTVLNALQPDTPLVEQLALSELIKKGYYERYLQKCKRTYAIKRASLIHALTKHFSDKVVIPRHTGGTQLLLRFDLCIPEEKLIQAARTAKLEMFTTSQNYALSDGPENEFLLGFSHIDENSIDEIVHEFARLSLTAKSTDYFDESV